MQPKNDRTVHARVAPLLFVHCLGTISIWNSVKPHFLGERGTRFDPSAPAHSPDQPVSAPFLRLPERHLSSVRHLSASHLSSEHGRRWSFSTPKAEKAGLRLFLSLCLGNQVSEGLN